MHLREWFAFRWWDG